MTTTEIMAPVDRLAVALRELTEQQLRLIETVVTQFRRPFLKIERWPGSDIVDARLLRDFGDVLRIHHCFSKEALSKDRFEYALEKTLSLCGKTAALAASRTNRGHDLTVEIPKALLQEAEGGELEICRKTKQETRPGYCRVMDTDGNLKFELYFDAGSERKLQIWQLGLFQTISDRRNHPSACRARANRHGTPIRSLDLSPLGVGGR